MFNFPWGMYSYRSLNYTLPNQINPMATIFVFTIPSNITLILPPRVQTNHPITSSIPPYQPLALHVISFKGTTIPSFPITIDLSNV
jgi:hypothetical protein